MPSFPTPPPAGAPDERDDRFPSGPWGGFFQQRGNRPTEQAMHFAGGRLGGGGADGTGPFTLRGVYDVRRGTATWTKTYPRHDVEYRGFAEDGSLWGTWTLDGGRDGGGFRLWPGKRGTGDDASQIREAKPAVVSGDADDPLADAFDDCFADEFADERELAPVGAR